eukprot:1209601-Rhodomonas_salina.2
MNASLQLGVHARSAGLILRHQAMLHRDGRDSDSVRRKSMGRRDLESSHALRATAIDALSRSEHPTTTLGEDPAAHALKQRRSCCQRKHVGEVSQLGGEGERRETGQHTPVQDS